MKPMRLTHYPCSFLAIFLLSVSAYFSFRLFTETRPPYYGRELNNSENSEWIPNEVNRDTLFDIHVKLADSFSLEKASTVVDVGTFLNLQYSFLAKNEEKEISFFLPDVFKKNVSIFLHLNAIDKHTNKTLFPSNASPLTSLSVPDAHRLPRRYLLDDPKGILLEERKALIGNISYPLYSIPANTEIFTAIDHRQMHSSTLLSQWGLLVNVNEKAYSFQLYQNGFLEDPHALIPLIPISDGHLHPSFDIPRSLESTPIRIRYTTVSTYELFLRGVLLKMYRPLIFAASQRDTIDTFRVQMAGQNCSHLLSYFGLSLLQIVIQLFLMDANFHFFKTKLNRKTVSILSQFMEVVFLLLYVLVLSRFDHTLFTIIIVVIRGAFSFRHLTLLFAENFSNESEEEKIAFKALELAELRAMLPYGATLLTIFAGISVHQLLFVPHPNWKNWILESIFVLLTYFGFFAQIPQMIRNNKLKSCNSIAWIPFSLLLASTLVDTTLQLFLGMPASYRFSTGRDDVVVVLFLIQMYVISRQKDKKIAKDKKAQ
ncbi:hypothetical protein IE077_001216 [Cardiosporidium cionae]|uniref:Cleft lip and palate associated transmembrane protein n=1 Tax=Cardiosporidium cionae TaxID=476202 RepID=A0ABQ7JDE4_9APIC|nr:hypothetical protein IE077_001216 [Cardiosporidium cionae]|eukprot:KAF8822020.1 hypothetical protein IE077_001216 [Cardiosporidium cionae]